MSDASYHEQRERERAARERRDAMTVDDKIAAIRAWQTSGRWHPLTCGIDSCRADLEGKKKDGLAVLACPACGNEQSWIPPIVFEAWAFGAFDDHARLENPPSKKSVVKRDRCCSHYCEECFEGVHAHGATLSNCRECGAGLSSIKSLCDACQLKRMVCQRCGRQFEN